MHIVAYNSQPYKVGCKGIGVALAGLLEEGDIHLETANKGRIAVFAPQYDPCMYKSQVA